MGRMAMDGSGWRMAIKAIRPSAQGSHSMAKAQARNEVAMASPNPTAIRDSEYQVRPAISPPLSSWANADRISVTGGNSSRGQIFRRARISQAKASAARMNAWRRYLDKQSPLFPCHSVRPVHRIVAGVTLGLCAQYMPRWFFLCSIYLPPVRSR